MNDLPKQLTQLLTQLLAYLDVPAKLDRVLANQEKIMTAVDDLKASLARLATDISAEIAALAAAQASGNDAAIEDAVAKLTDLSVQLEASLAPKAP